jgi:hypothetical protein
VPIVEMFVPLCSWTLFHLHGLDALVLDLDAALHSIFNLNLMLILRKKLDLRFDSRA